jgi:hypothetical protein
MVPPYCVREDVKEALDVLETARANGDIDRQIAGGARAIDGRLHRVFYPTVASRSFDWPDIQVAKPWRQWLDDNELISITGVSSGGVSIPLDTVIPYPNTGPPYNRVELDVSTNSAWSAGQTWQNSITIDGLYGFRADEIPAGALPADLNATDTTVNLGVPGYRGVGSLLRIDTERMLVTGRATTTTGQILGADLAVANSAVLVQVADITLFAVGETILIDGERMQVQDAAGVNLIVKRAYDGSVLAAHTSGATIYANRSLTVVRGALGTTTATHSMGAPIAEHDPPDLVRQLNVALAIVGLTQTRAGYPQPVRAGLGGSATTPVAGRPTTRPSDMTELWDQAYTAYGRKTRVRTV